MRRNASLVGAAVVIVVGLALTVVPLPRPPGMDTSSFSTLVVSVATLVATVLVWYGLFTEPS